MAHYGPIWPQIPALQGLFQLYYGWIRLARVYGLWFTRERSKVRSLVRPPFADAQSTNVIRLTAMIVPSVARPLMVQPAA